MDMASAMNSKNADNDAAQQVWGHFNRFVTMILLADIAHKRKDPDAFLANFVAVWKENIQQQMEQEIAAVQDLHPGVVGLLEVIDGVDPLDVYRKLVAKHVDSVEEAVSVGCVLVVNKLRGGKDLDDIIGGEHAESDSEG